MFLNNAYYALRPYIPRRLQLFIRRQRVRTKKRRYEHIWPIDPHAGRRPMKFKGWPDGKQFALVLSHDVDTQRGHDDLEKLLDLEERLGFRSSINLVPERYCIAPGFIERIKARGHQVCVHGLYHDGKLFSSREIFNQRAVKINRYLDQWGSEGFTSPSMHHNLEWMHMLQVAHATSTFDTDPFEPQPDSIRTIFPFQVCNSRAADRGYIELPLTLPQDHLLFVIMQHSRIDIWQKKLAWIAEKGGMALLNTHSDYMDFGGGSPPLETYPAAYYAQFLEHVRTAYKGRYWHALPGEVAAFWNANVADCERRVIGT